MRRLVLATCGVALALPVSEAAVARDRSGHAEYEGKVWRDSHGKLRCKRSDGTVGLIVGAGGGALLGRAIDTHGERATGTILGAAAGALIGHRLERSHLHCR